MPSFHTSFEVPYVGATPLLGRSGIGAAGVYNPKTQRGVVLLVDGGPYNRGASVTNSIVDIVNFLHARFGAQFPLQRFSFVEYDSEGCYDLIELRWHPEGGVCGANFEPLQHPGEAARSEGAMRARFGRTAEILLTWQKNCGVGREIQY